MFNNIEEENKKKNETNSGKNSDFFKNSIYSRFDHCHGQVNQCTVTPNQITDTGNVVLAKINRSRRRMSRW